MTKTNIDKAKAAYVAINAQRNILDQMRADLQTEYDEHSETWQEGDAGEELSAEISILETVVDGLDDALLELDNV